MLRVSYTKRDGEWMLKIEGSNHEREKLGKGCQIRVVKRDGSEKTEILGQAVDIQRDYTIALIATPKTTRPATQGRRDYMRAGKGRVYHGEPGRRYNDDGTVTHSIPGSNRTWTEY